MRFILLSSFLYLFFVASAQNEPNSFTYSHYWKNRKPHAAYWQQDVHYTINAVINDEKNEIKTI